MKAQVKNIVMLTLMSLFVCFSSMSVSAQDAKPEEPLIKLKATADVVSSYIFRGVLATPSPSPNFQPTLAGDIGNLEIGAWGSTNYTGDYKEVDLYGTYTLGPVGITLTDYFFSNQGPNYTSLATAPRYFTYEAGKTGHIFEGSLTYSGPTNFPISLLLATMFYGNDKQYDFTAGGFSTNNNYSTYIEAGYTFGGVAKAFIGATPWNGYYGAGYGQVKGFGIVNLGVSGTRNIVLTDKFSLPVKAALYFNPQAEQVHLVFGITF
jgi:hypothetical protein